MSHDTTVIRGVCMGLGTPGQARECVDGPKWCKPLAAFGENKPGCAWCSSGTELREVLGPPSSGDAQLHRMGPRTAWLDSELSLAWSRGLTRALQTLLPALMFLEYCDASMPLSPHRLLMGHRRVIAGGPHGIWCPNRTGTGLPPGQLYPSNTSSFP